MMSEPVCGVGDSRLASSHDTFLRPTVRHLHPSCPPTATMFSPHLRCHLARASRAAPSRWASTSPPPPSTFWRNFRLFTGATTLATISYFDALCPPEFAQLDGGYTEGPLVRARHDATENWVFIHVERALCGHEGVIHGGLPATLLDGTLARVVSLRHFRWIPWSPWRETWRRCARIYVNQVVNAGYVCQVDGVAHWELLQTIQPLGRP